MNENLANQIAKTWGRNVRAQRNLVGMTQAHLAEVCQVNPATVSKWESGTQIIPSRLVPIIARTLRAPASILFPWPTLTGEAA